MVQLHVLCFHVTCHACAWNTFSAPHHIPVKNVCIHALCKRFGYRKLHVLYQSRWSTRISFFLLKLGKNLVSLSLTLTMYFVDHVLYCGKHGNRLICICYPVVPLEKGYPFCQMILSLLERFPLVRGSITYIYGTCCQEIVSPLESVL